jgi:uncharacterized OsmC-like protein
MPSIESIGGPLVFKAEERGEVPDSGTGRIAIRAEVRALEGMQKEAIVHYGPTGTAWRMVSDEGPYLNGTDLAPFPLAFYTAGMAFSFMTELLRHARVHDVDVRSLKLTQDNYYTMQGSAIRGDMLGGAKPAEIKVELDTDAPDEIVDKLVRLAEQSSPAQSYMRDVLQNTFSLNFNGRPLEVVDVSPSAGDQDPDPAPTFDQLNSLDESAYQPDIIVKLKAADKVFGVEGGAGSSLKATQKRTLHVRGVGTLRDDGIKEMMVQLFKPIGSTFRFLSQEPEESAGTETAPPALAYLSAGVGFCYMTQMGRYAHIVKQNLKSYRIVQENIFNMNGSLEEETLTALAEPVDTQVYVDMDESDEAAQKLVRMSERTCFLHAAMRNSRPTQIQSEISRD